MNQITVILENANTLDYYELEKILIRNGINAKVNHKELDGSELGLTFEELIILLPLLTPIVVQLRKAFEAFLDYKKPLNRKISITLEKKGKKLQITSENNDLIDIKELSSFFDEN